MVAPAPSTPSSPAGPPAPGRSASRVASDRRGATEVLPEIDVFHHRARRRPEHAVAAPCIGRPRPHRRDTHPGRRRFSGQTRGGRYSWARYYHPGLQRFISEDPLDFLAGDVNLYAYVSNSPTNFTDATGLFVDIAVDAALIGYDIYSLVTGGRKDFVVNSMALGGDIVGAIVPGLTGVGPAIRGARAANRVTKAVNLPAWRKIAIDLRHIAERHMAEGALTAGRSIFPAHMSQAAVERAVRQAYRYGEKVATQGERVLVRGEAHGLTIEMWVNRATKTIETAYPLGR